MKTITFQVSKTKEIEPEIFFYGIVIESEEVDKSIKSIESILKGISNIEKVKLTNHNYTISDNEDDLMAIQILKVIGRNDLKGLIQKLHQIEGIRGGIIRTEIKDEESQELELMEELTQNAKKKAYEYAKLCSKELLDIKSFKVISNQGGWTGYPPVRGLNRQSIYNSILMQYDKKDKFEISKTVEVQFEMK